MDTSLLGPDGPVNKLLAAAGDLLWAYLPIAALVATGLYFTIRTRFVQLRMVGEMFRLLVDSPGKSAGGKSISSFQAFAVSVATRIGTGNLAGVATAIVIGGPGAVFWMWMIALVGAATAFVESTLAQLYKRRIGNGLFIGGPAYYILHGLRCPWLAALFAVLMTFTFGLSYNSIQSNTICSAMHAAFALDPLWVGVALVAFSMLIVFGGIRRIANVSSVLVPIMAIGYFVLAAVVVGMNIKHVPQVFRMILDSAFGVGQFAGGAIGVTMMSGIKRGLFSNEAGEGSAPNAAATASTSHPVKQGLIQSLGVFTDTLLVCSCTAFIILISGVLGKTSLNGIALTQAALESQVGAWGKIFVAAAILIFAYSSIIGNYYYGEANVRFLTRRRWAVTLFRVLSGGVMVMFGALASLETVWSLGDLAMALLTACNLVAILLLGKQAFRLLDDYRAQKKRGTKDPVFRASQMPDIQQRLDAWHDEDGVD